MENKINNLETNSNIITRKEIMKLFLEEKTIDFILNNYPNFLEKIDIENIQKTAKFYLDNTEIDSNFLMKWMPVFLDIDRTKLIISYLKKENFKIEEITCYLGNDINKVINNTNKLKKMDEKISIINDESYKKINLDVINSINKSRVNNEGFNNLIDNNIKKYEPLLRRLT